MFRNRLLVSVVFLLAANDKDSMMMMISASDLISADRMPTESPKPSPLPSMFPTPRIPPTESPKPSPLPSYVPTVRRTTSSPTESPKPSPLPSHVPTLRMITEFPTESPKPSPSPSATPTLPVSALPTDTSSPSLQPSQTPFDTTATAPTTFPTTFPTVFPTRAPTLPAVPPEVTEATPPTKAPTPHPTPFPSPFPTPFPTKMPVPFAPPTPRPTPEPSAAPGLFPAPDSSGRENGNASVANGDASRSASLSDGVVVVIAGFVVLLVALFGFLLYRRMSDRRMRNTGHTLGRSAQKVPPPRAFAAYQDNIAPARHHDEGDADSTTPQADAGSAAPAAAQEDGTELSPMKNVVII